MRCGQYVVQQVMVGLYRVGIVGLRKACAAVAAAGHSDREKIVDALLEELAPENYITENEREAYRIALWREYLRATGREFSEFFSHFGVTVRGEHGEDRDRLIELCRSVLADFELQPDIELEPAADEGPNPQLVIGDAVIARGLPSRRVLKATIRRRISDW